MNTHNWSFQTKVDDAVKKHDKKKYSRKAFTDEQLFKMLKEYNSGMTTRQLAKKYETSKTTIQYGLKKVGGKLRKRGVRKGSEGSRSKSKKKKNLFKISKELFRKILCT